jgi:hypothetical protein
MKFPLMSLAVSLGLGALALPAAAQTIEDVNPGLPDNSFYAENIPFETTVGGDQLQLAGFNYRTVAGFGPGRVYDFCANFFVGSAYEGLIYDVETGLGTHFGASQNDAIGALFSNSLAGFDTLLGDYLAVNGGSWDYNPLFANQYDALQGYAAGMQIALWEIIHDGTGNGLSVIAGGANPGDFRVEDIPDDPANPRAESGLLYAEEFLTYIRNNTWTNTGGVTFHYAIPTTPGEQDRLWVNVVPEPSSALLGAAGFLLLLRRRRA